MRAGPTKVLIGTVGLFFMCLGPLAAAPLSTGAVAIVRAAHTHTPLVETIYYRRYYHWPYYHRYYYHRPYYHRYYYHRPYYHHYYYHHYYYHRPYYHRYYYHGPYYHRYYHRRYYRRW
jgi:hypothetical protein